MKAAIDYLRTQLDSGWIDDPKEISDYRQAIRILEAAGKVDEVKQAIDVLSRDSVRFCHIIALLEALLDKPEEEK